MKLLTPEETAEYLLAHDGYTILTHLRPDGDTSGSAAALCAGLRSVGKRASVLVNPQTTELYAPYLEGLTCERAEGCIVSVDVSSAGRLPLNYQGKVDLSIDHHDSNTGFAPLTCLEGSAGACAELIFKILHALRAEITPAMADALYVGLSTDTGCFRYSNTSPQTHRTAAALQEAGAGIKKINHELFEIKSRSRLETEAYLLRNMEFYYDGRIGLALLPDAVLDEYGATEDDIDAIAGFARTIKGVEIGALLRECAGGSKVSLRTDENLWNAAEICLLLGGGGHAAAAGASLNCSIEELREKVLQVLGRVTGCTMKKA